MVVDLYFDFLSPYSYLANHRLSALAGRYGFSIRYHAIDLVRAKVAIGNIGPSNRELTVKLDYLKVDLQRWADLYGIPLVFPPNYNSHRMNAGLYYPAARERAADYVRLVFDAVWGKGVAPDADGLPSLVCDMAGWDKADFDYFLNSEGATKAYDMETQAAIERKVFGVPTMFLGDEMWWGNDRIFMLESKLKKEALS